MDKVIKILLIIIKVIKWLIVNVIPFLRGIIEEIKIAQANKKAKNLL